MQCTMHMEKYSKQINADMGGSYLFKNKIFNNFLWLKYYSESFVVFWEKYSALNEGNIHLAVT